MATSPKPLTLTPSLVRRLLVELGPAPQYIARKLRRLKIKGVPGKSAACPLAVYLKYKLALAGIDHPAVLVQPQWAEMRFPRSFSVKLPDACAAFVTRFDIGTYKALER